VTQLAGKTALVTGASRGIGRATALALAEAGAQVLVHYGKAAKEAEAVVAEIVRKNGRAQAVAGDLTAPDGPHKLAKQVRSIVGEHVDLFVANAGISRHATIEDTTLCGTDAPHTCTRILTQRTNSRREARNARSMGSKLEVSRNKPIFYKQA